MANRTTTEFLKNLVTISKTGLEQVFIIEALADYCERVVTMPEEQIIEEEAKRPIINIRAWVRTAKEIEKQIKDEYGNK